uniref:Secreted protein n=1 Tax=Cacopsylla melanoneura TaxID=428564 RepID=A0A8D8Z7N5_9HEMI
MRRRMKMCPMLACLCWTISMCPMLACFCCTISVRGLTDYFEIGWFKGYLGLRVNETGQWVSNALLTVDKSVTYYYKCIGFKIISETYSNVTSQFTLLSWH